MRPGIADHLWSWKEIIDRKDVMAALPDF